MPVLSSHSRGEHITTCRERISPVIHQRNTYPRGVTGNICSGEHKTRETHLRYACVSAAQSHRCGTPTYRNVLISGLLLGSTVVSPYVGMARKQNGGYNASISVQTPIFHLVVNSTRLKTVRSPRWCCPNSTMAPRLLENVVKVTNLEVVKIVFRHLPFLILLLLLLLLQPA